MTESELLIKIRTALEAGGIEAAKKELANLTKATSGTATAAKEVEQGFGKFARLSNNLRNAMHGNAQAIANLQKEFGALGKGAGMAASLIGSAFVGWKLGEMIEKKWKVGEKFWARVMGLNEFDKTTGSIRERVDKLVESFKELDQQQLDGLLSELDAVDKRMSRFEKKSAVQERFQRESLQIRQEEESAALELQFAGKDKGPEYERRSAELSMRHASETQELENKILAERETIQIEERNNLIQKREAVMLEAKAIKEELQRAKDLALVTGFDKDIENAKQLEERATKKLPEYSKADQEYSSAIEDMNLAIDTTSQERHFGQQRLARVSTTQYQTSLASASADEQRIRAEQEATALAAKQQAEKDAMQAQIDQAKERYRQQQEVAQGARQAADDYNPRGAGKGFAAAKAKDMALDEAAANEQQALDAIGNIVANMTQKMKEMDAQFERALRDFRSTNKAMPI